MADRQTSSFKDQITGAVPIVLFAQKAGAATAAALPGRFYNATNRNLRVSKVHVSAGTAPAGSALTVDVKVGTDSVFAVAGDRAKIAAGQNAGEAPATATDVTVAPGDYVAVEITGVGSGTAGSDVVVQVHLV